MKIVTGNLSLLISTAVVLVSLLMGFLVRRTVLVPLARRAAKTPRASDSAFVASLRRPLPVWFVLLGAFIVTRTIGVPSWLAPSLDKVMTAVLIFSVTLWAANLVAKLLLVGGKSGSAIKATSATGVVRNVARVAVLVIGGLVLLSTFGVSIAPVFTTVGLGGLAVALGLQKTLSNLFAGMEITVEGNIRVGDFLKLESGEEGYVEDIHWRTTRVRTLFNNSVLIPNSQLVDSVVTNYHLPTKSFALLVAVGVDPASDLERVERVTIDVARAIMKSVAGGVPDFEPFIRYHAFAESSIDFNVILRAQEFTDNFRIRHEFIKALTRAFAAAGIVLPFPTRVLRLAPDQARH